MPAAVETYDCIVLGVGGFGSGTLYNLARQGVRALGIEQFDVAHDRGSSHGETRIIRKAYFEHPDYVPLLVRAYELWNELQSETAQKLAHLCGLFLVGPADGEAVPGAEESARRYGVPLERVPTVDAARRFPGFQFPSAMDVVHEPEAGYLLVEDCVRAHVHRAVALGATLKTGESVTEWSSDGNTVRVGTDRAQYEAATLVITAGPWSAPVLNDLSVPLKVVRKPHFWYEVTTDQYNADRSPAWLFEMPTGVFYGFPSVDGNIIKSADHSGGEEVADPSHLDRQIRDEDHRPVDDFLSQSLPGVNPTPVRDGMCMYTHTADGHFIIDHHPQFPNVVIGAGFSGHGFKFTTVLGQALSDLAIDGQTDLPIDFLSLGRDALKSEPT